MTNTRLDKARELLGSMITTAKVALQTALDTIPPPPPEPDLDDVVDDDALPVRTQKMAELLIQQGQLRAGAKMFDELAQQTPVALAGALLEAKAHALSDAVARREGIAMWALPKHTRTPVADFEVTRLLDEHEAKSLRAIEIAAGAPGKVRSVEARVHDAPPLWVWFPSSTRACVLALLDGDHITSVLTVKSPRV